MPRSTSCSTASPAAWPALPETARLTLRRPRIADTGALFRFMGDPAVMRLTRCHASPRALRRTLAAHACQRRKTGFGPWTVLETATAAIIGFGGLYEDPFDPGWGLEVAYFLAPAAQGRGFARELVAASLATAWAAGAPRVDAFAHPDNAASRGVLRGSGFRLLRHVPEMDRLLYRHDRPA